MTGPGEFKEISPPTPSNQFGGDHVSFGIPVPKQKRLELLDPDEWEAFVEEWAQSLKTTYHRVKRHSGAGDQGLDVVGLLKSEQLEDGYDSYQCKHYDHPLRPSDVWIELAKVIHHTFRGDYPVPRQYFFVAPHGIGTKLQKLLGQAAKLEQGLKENWDGSCRDELGAAGPVELVEPLSNYVDDFDFTIFKSVSAANLIEGHATTPFHTVRFGGGLPERGDVIVPAEFQPNELRFTEQLMEAYSDNAKTTIKRDEITSTSYHVDYKKQRERFFSAESLRNFARDNVPPGTFEDLQEQALDSVFDVCQEAHPCGLTRMRAALNQVSSVHFGSSPLFTRIREPDKKGFCHQLANEDKLKWVP